MSIPINNPAATPPRPCELCGSTDYKFLFNTEDRLGLAREVFRIVQCRNCGVWRTLPDMTEAELAAFYPKDYWGGEPAEKWIRASQADKTDFIKKCQLQGGRLLDVGCGAGFFLRALNQQTWQAYGVELGEPAAHAAQQIFGNAHIFTGTLLEAKFAPAFFDVVTFWSALEHTNEPHAHLREARRILPTGGTVIIQLPNAASYQARYFRGDWFALDAPRHRYHFTLPTLQKLLHDTGFEFYRSTLRSPVHNVHALRQSLKARWWHQSTAKRAAFLLAIPFLKPCDFLLSSVHQGATLTVAARAV
ncbi:MAG: methyltransferase domain-containing protein [Acidobacteria bacterium]|nr:methyltransferase domain-containing protein [Acidobacteriota bacterium]